MRKKTALIHGGISIDPNTGALSLPISQASTFRQQKVGDFVYEYARSGNPTREGLEKLIADIEGGHAGFAFASGMAAISTVMDLFKTGDHLIVTDDVYGGTYRLFSKVLEKRGIAVDFVDTSDEDAVKQAIRKETKALYLETPTNPLLKVSSIAAMQEIAQENGALLIVDNTFSTPYWQRPIENGADIVIHSATKYLGGHSDVVAGLVVTANNDLSKQLQFLQNSTGAVLAPNDSWLVQRGIKTLGVRMEEIEKNTMTIASFLSEHEAVEKVYYPGLINHPGRDVHLSQASGFSGMLSFTVKDEKTALHVLEGVQYFTLAESLGAVESLISLPAKMTHASIPRNRRLQLGIEDGLIRLSVGLEDVHDLVEDLKASLT